MEFYPYRLYILKTEKVVFDDMGFVSESKSESFEFHSKCRDYPNKTGADTIIDVETKKLLRYSAMIMLPLDCEAISPNTQIEVRDKEGRLRLSAYVIRFERNQLHCRIWV